MIIFTEHAFEKLAQRSIKKSLVLETLKNPDRDVLSYGDRRVAYKKFKKLYLAVVYKGELGDILVITAHWVEKMKNK